MIMKRRRKFEKSFKLEVVQRSLEGITLKELSAELGIHESVIARWRRQYLSTGEKSFPGNGVELISDEEKEIRQLKKELAEAKFETQILKKAIRIFSKSDGRSLNS